MTRKATSRTPPRPGEIVGPVEDPVIGARGAFSVTNVYRLDEERRSVSELAVHVNGDGTIQYPEEVVDSETISIPCEGENAGAEEPGQADEEEQADQLPDEAEVGGEGAEADGGATPSLSVDLDCNYKFDNDPDQRRLNYTVDNPSGHPWEISHSQGAVGGGTQTSATSEISVRGSGTVSLHYDTDGEYGPKGGYETLAATASYDTAACQWVQPAISMDIDCSDPSSPVVNWSMTGTPDQYYSMIIGPVGRGDDIGNVGVGVRSWGRLPDSGSESGTYEGLAELPAGTHELYAFTYDSNGLRYRLDTSPPFTVPACEEGGGGG